MCTGGKLFLIGTGKATGGDHGWGHVSPYTCQWGSLPGESPEAHKRWQQMLKWSPEVIEIWKNHWRCQQLGTQSLHNCQWGSLPGVDAQGYKTKHSQERHGSNGKSAHANIDIDNHYDIKYVYVQGEFRRLQMMINTVSMEQHEDDYIRPNADLDTRLQIKSNEHLKCMYTECGDDISELKDFEYYIGLDSNKPRVQTPYKVGLSVEFGLRKTVRSDWKTRHGW